MHFRKLSSTRSQLYEQLLSRDLAHLQLSSRCRRRHRLDAARGGFARLPAHKGLGGMPSPQGVRG